METVIVAVDFKFSTTRLMEETRKYAKALGASVVLVNLEPLLPGAEGAAEEELASDMQKNYGEEIQTIHGLGKELGAAGIDNRVLLIEGEASEQMVREVERERPALIIIGSRPHGALVEALTHGLREQLARRLSCPILLVPVE
jgi:nucleotide-binding universal stress UspA family protein